MKAVRTADSPVTVTRTTLPPFEQFARVLGEAWASRQVTNDGPLAQELERALRSFLELDELALVSNGTIAIELALRGLGIRGEVVTTPFTFPATANAILWAGLIPRFVDIDPETFNIDPDAVSAAVTDRTSCILPVHVYGNPCETRHLAEIAAKHDLRVIYDAAHAFGVRDEGGSVLRAGDASTVSFHATKVYHTVEGGAVVSRRAELIRDVKVRRNHGIASESDVLVAGTNAKLSELHAAMGLCNISGFEANVDARRSLYMQYKEGLAGIPGVSFQKLHCAKYNYGYMPICFGSGSIRERVYNGLKRNRVYARRYFWPLLTDHHYLRGFSRSTTPIAADLAGRVLCLPLYSDLTTHTVDEICKLVRGLSMRG